MIHILVLKKFSNISLIKLIDGIVPINALERKNLLFWVQDSILNMCPNLIMENAGDSFIPKPVLIKQSRVH